MIQTFTLNDVVRFVYDEMDDDEAFKIREAMLLDDELMDECHQMMDTKLTLDANPVSISPSNMLTNKILEYSRSYGMEEEVT